MPSPEPSWGIGLTLKKCSKSSRLSVREILVLSLLPKSPSPSVNAKRISMVSRGIPPPRLWSMAVWLIPRYLITGSAGNSGGLEQVLASSKIKRQKRKYPDFFIIITNFDRIRAAVSSVFKMGQTQIPPQFDQKIRLFLETGNVISVG